MNNSKDYNKTINGIVELLNLIKTDILINSHTYREKLIIDVADCERIINKYISNLKGGKA